MIDRIDMDPMQQRLSALMHEPIEMVAYDPRWPLSYAIEERMLRALLPGELVLSIDHIGSTAVPGLSAKPIVDIQIGVSDIGRVRDEVVPRMIAAGYEFIWRPSIGEREPFYAWFLKRDDNGHRTHHVHMVSPDEATEARILFRDHLRKHVEQAERYQRIKQELATHHGNDRAAYTKGKSEFIATIVAMARLSAE